MTTLGPLVLPFSEQAMFILNLVMRKLMPKKKLRPYIPDFKKAFEKVQSVLTHTHTHPHTGHIHRTSQQHTPEHRAASFVTRHVSECGT